MHQVSSPCPWESFTASCYLEMQVLKPNWGRKRAGKLPEGWECGVAPARHLLVGTEGSQLSSVRLQARARLKPLTCPGNL